MLKFKKLGTLLASLSLSVFMSQSVLAAASYQVVSGDSLYKIGQAFNTSATTIASRNGLSGSFIYPGQVLNVPGDTYYVKSGDSLFLIAKKYGRSLYSLRRANNIWSDTIYPGQKLAVPLFDSSASVSTSAQTTTSNAVISYTASDVDLLARLITAEAESEPYNAKVAVGAVIVNRVKDSRFPSTINGVIYQVDAGYYQFSPVLNGYINKPASQDAINAAYAALHGSDPTKGALYYFDDSTTNTWLWSKPIAIRIDRMVFTYY